ncbi:DUF4397 domain-containing protein [Pedobacter sp. MW01-1-1]|uniref:DUF4397 domain-containing protein n=1 Tax=Pedobacter sp. MW01-1-1 TaxID=3383027 RepID=UPI003FEE3FAD
MKIFYSISILSVLIILGLASCTKNEINYGEYTKITGDEALLKVNYNIALTANPGVQIKVNGTRVSTLITSRYPYPGGGYNTGGDSRPDYLTISPGNNTVSIVIPKKGTNIDSLELYKTSIVTEAGKNYTLHVTDTTSTTSSTKSLLVTDDFALPDSGFVKYRFVHLMPNVGALDLYNGTTLVAKNLSYLSASDYFILPTGTPTGTAWSIRLTGTAPTSTAIATYTSASTITNRRSYTVFATGYAGRTDAVRKPYLSFFLIR